MADAIIILALGHVFIANMTGNIAFLGFAAAGAAGFSLAASLAALASFLIEAGAGGQFVNRFSGDRAILLRNGTAAELFFVAVARQGGPKTAAGDKTDAPFRVIEPEQGGECSNRAMTAQAGPADE